jgi:hypothetical protein
MAFYDLLADGQAYTGAGIFLPRVQPLEDGEKTILFFGWDADAIVFNPEDIFAPFSLRSNVDLGATVFGTELDGIAHQVLE